jgi:hypothetical protein
MNTSITALELVENNLDIKSQDTSGHEAGDELDQVESATKPGARRGPGRPRKTARKAE